MKKRHSKSLVVVDGVRTPFTRMGTGLAGLSAVDLGRVAVNQLLTRTGIDPSIVDETIIGCVSQPAEAANIARVIALRAGIPESVPAMTVHRNCGSGLEALTTAAERMTAGHGEVFVVGGTESMSQIPLFFSLAAAAKFTALSRARGMGGRLGAMARFRPSDFAPIIGLKLGLTDPVVDLNMGETAEVLAREFGISREAQDEFALASHVNGFSRRAERGEEIVPVYLPGKSPDFVQDDNGVREGQSMEALARLNPVFDRKTGTVTAGNSSQITDGAAALLVMTEERADKLGLTPLGRLIESSFVGCDPRRMGLGPALAIAELKEKTGLKPSGADVIEINEAFAAQVLAVLKTLEEKSLPVPRERLNPLGGAIALGHPVGASGARLVLTALKQLQRHGDAGSKALVSLCIGGGQGGAAWLEKI